MNAINSLLRPLFQFVNGLGPNGWAVVAVVLVLAGVFCMKGYGESQL